MLLEETPVFLMKTHLNNMLIYYLPPKTFKRPMEKATSDFKQFCPGI